MYSEKLFEVTFIDNSPVYVQLEEGPDFIANEQFISDLKLAGLFYHHASGYIQYINGKYSGIRKIIPVKDYSIELVQFYLKIAKNKTEQRRARRLLKQIQRYRRIHVSK